MPERPAIISYFLKIALGMILKILILRILFSTLILNDSDYALFDRQFFSIPFYAELQFLPPLESAYFIFSHYLTIYQKQEFEQLRKDIGSRGYFAVGNVNSSDVQKYIENKHF
ncbi:MAG: hypothetical protein sL5_05060 [Candidatus Mesenet longicola]|uniref:Uncharacterized protein n=1 Tax=Candidatus Mesenet longicola TaxID=1892558 RepID=A0A8J3HSM4_9RICK|nr:MAG: hypothetical protein sL5_05060 [Candidatus Mesenet longicola]